MFTLQTAPLAMLAGYAVTGVVSRCSWRCRCAQWGGRVWGEGEGGGSSGRSHVAGLCCTPIIGPCDHNSVLTQNVMYSNEAHSSGGVPCLHLAYLGAWECPGGAVVLCLAQRGLPTAVTGGAWVRAEVRGGGVAQCFPAGGKSGIPCGSCGWSVAARAGGGGVRGAGAGAGALLCGWLEPYHAPHMCDNTSHGNEQVRRRVQCWARACTTVGWGCRPWMVEQVGPATCHLWHIWAARGALWGGWVARGWPSACTPAPTCSAVLPCHQVPCCPLGTVMCLCVPSGCEQRPPPWQPLSTALAAARL